MHNENSQLFFSTWFPERMPGLGRSLLAYPVITHTHYM